MLTKKKSYCIYEGMRKFAVKKAFFHLIMGLLALSLSIFLTGCEDVMVAAPPSDIPLWNSANSGWDAREPGTPNPDGTVSVASVSLDVTQFSLAVTGGDANRTLQASISPANATNKNLIWTSSNSSVASVDAHGTVRAVGNGYAIITALSVDGGKIASAVVNVSSSARQNVRNLTAVGGNTQITINWSAPTDTQFQGVKITYTPGSGEPIVLPASSSSHTIAGLENGRAYTISVQAL